MKAIDCTQVLEKMGNDQTVVDTARISYAEGTKQTRNDRALIRYLIKHQHSSPLEMCVIRLRIKAPIFVVRQWMRHRMASINEESARYSVVKEEFFLPDLDKIHTQSVKNKQCSEGQLEEEKAKIARTIFDKANKEAYKKYKELLEMGVAREQARMVLPQSMMTSFILKMDLRNLLHLIELRMHSHAQAEFQEYAIVLFDIVKDWCPLVAEAFEEYVLHASRLSKTQVKATQELLHSGEIKTELSEREDKELKQVLKIT